MGTTHAASGVAVWLAGSAVATVLGAHVDPVTVLVGTGVCAAASLAPDIDHPSSRAARCGGFVTRLLAHVVGWSCARIHAATRTEADRPDEDGHRTLSHTALAAFAFGGLVAGALALVGIRWSAVAGWWWLGLPVAVGCLTHCLGDSLTESGCPILWPLRIAGRRWYPIGPPKAWRFCTGGAVERWLVRPGLAVVAGVASWLLLAPLVARG